MEIVAELLKILLPAALVLYAMYMTVNAFLVKEFEKRLVDLKTKNTELVLPTRLQAYERMCLLLERISPHNLILRLNNPDYNALQLQHVLVHEIREEFNHNLAQQVYMTEEAWLLVKNAKEEVIGLINAAAEKVDREAPSVELAKLIFETMLERNEDPTHRALRYIKDEVRQVF